MNTTKALRLTLMWVILALAFNTGIYVCQGSQKALEFLTGYVVELSLSVDNIFVFLLIFSHFKTSAAEQSRILFWGVLGAQLMRGIFILAGVALLTKFQWLIYIMGLFLILTGIKLFRNKENDIHPEDNAILGICKKVSPALSKFWIVLIIVETTDLIFALDSIPAILAITKDPFIVYTSNIFAILGLRVMYFALAGLMPVFYHLHYAIGAILIFVGLKMTLEHYVHIPVIAALAFIILTLLTCVITSLMFPKKNKHVA